MVEIVDAVRSVGAELTGTAGATAKLNFTSGAGYTAAYQRKGVLIANNGAAGLYVKFVNSGASAPTVTATNFHAQVGVGAGPLIIRCPRSLDIYVFGTDKYAALEIG